MAFSELKWIISVHSLIKHYAANQFTFDPIQECLPCNSTFIISKSLKSSSLFWNVHSVVRVSYTYGLLEVINRSLGKVSTL